jgi:hypothetical protein
MKPGLNIMPLNSSPLHGNYVNFFLVQIYIKPEDGGTHSSEMLIDFQQTTRHYIPEDIILQFKIYFIYCFGVYIYSHMFAWL